MTGKLHTWSRTAKYYRDLGWFVVKAEYTARGRRHDFLGFIDGMALGDREMIGLQACGGSDFAEHRRKILGPCRRTALLWLKAGNQIHLVGWRQIGKPKKWTPRIEEITLADFETETKQGESK